MYIKDITLNTLRTTNQYSSKKWDICSSLSSCFSTISNTRRKYTCCLRELIGTMQVLVDCPELMEHNLKLWKKICRIQSYSNFLAENLRNSNKTQVITQNYLIVDTQVVGNTPVNVLSWINDTISNTFRDFACTIKSLVNCIFK